MKSDQIPSSYLGKVVTEYENTGLDQLCLPFGESLALAKECAVSICSDLPRAISSINVLGLKKVNQIDPVYRESALPYLEWKITKLTLFSWAIIFRLAWFCGFSKNGEPIQEAKRRANVGTDKLEELAKEKGSVLYMGHGIMNRLIIKELKTRSWQVKERTGEKYWSYTVLENET